MMGRLNSGRRIRQWNNVFVETFEDFETTWNLTESGDGIIVEEQGKQNAQFLYPMHLLKL